MAGKSAKTNQSPCVDLCDFTGPKGWCRGCGRTRSECTDWKSMKPYAKQTLLAQLRKRMARMQSSA